MIKIYKDNKGEVYILNSRKIGFRLSDVYWSSYGNFKLTELKSLIIDNSKQKVITTEWGKRIEIKILYPKFKFNIPHFIIKSKNGLRVITKEKTYPSFIKALGQDLYKISDLKGSKSSSEFIKDNYKNINSIKIKSS